MPLRYVDPLPCERCGQIPSIDDTRWKDGRNVLCGTPDCYKKCSRWVTIAEWNMRVMQYNFDAAYKQFQTSLNAQAEKIERVQDKLDRAQDAIHAISFFDENYKNDDPSAVYSKEFYPVIIAIRKYLKENKQ